MAVDWMGIVKTVAPTVASALLGPLGGAAVAAIGGIIGVPDATQETIKQVITNGQLTQEQIGKLRELELKYKADEAERGFRYAELEFKDADSARQMQIATNSKIPGILAVFITLGFFGILVGMMLGKLATTEQQPLLIMLGALGASWGAVVNFYFGSSHGSAQKTALLAQAQPIK